MKKDTLTPRLRAIQNPKTMEGVLYRVAKLARNEARERVPKKTHNLQRTIRIGDVNAHRALLLAGGQREVGYAKFVEFGTKGGQMIRPVNKKALAWGGARRLSGTLRSGAKAEFFSMGHKRGATRAKPYLVPGAIAAMRTAGILKGIVKAWDDAA
jgi:hypothetical protein